MISAKIICDSKNKFGNRLTTFVLVFPRIVLAEFNTHRAFSRNSASSRAIPFNKMVESVKTNPFIPIKWMKEHSGMQGVEYLEHPHEWDKCKWKWLDARDLAITMSQHLTEYGVTKQICNRLLEPFLWHTVLLTATEFENFFSLRADKNAEIHIQDLAEKMLIEYNNSEPKLLNGGEWHIPFADVIRNDEFKAIVDKLQEGQSVKLYEQYKLKIATARCARISYNNFEGKDDYEADIQLHDRLFKSGHFSPFEHCAKSMDDFEFHNHSLIQNKDIQFGNCGNFIGFIQYRKMLKDENRKDKRVIKK